MNRRKAILIVLASVLSFAIGFLSSGRAPQSQPFVSTASAQSMTQACPQ